ncbi:hypothetical protein B9Z55_015408 [Caenorhabditis nigoni]|nr:hypothetical protein B9Z55_015408 [Caenorhabditis nigoni]
MYVCLTSLAIFVHWMWFSNYDMVIGRKMKKNTLKPGHRVFMKGLALPSAYYEELKKRKEDRKNEETKVDV